MKIIRVFSDVFLHKNTMHMNMNQYFPVIQKHVYILFITNHTTQALPIDQCLQIHLFSSKISRANVCFYIHVHSIWTYEHDAENPNTFYCLTFERFWTQV